MKTFIKNLGMYVKNVLVGMLVVILAMIALGTVAGMLVFG